MAPKSTQLVVAEAESWADRNRVLLDICFAEFAGSARWPAIETLEHRLELAGETITASRLVHGMPEALGFAEHGQLVLLCRGLLQIDMAQDLLADWFQCVRKAYSSWMEDPDASLDSGQIGALIHADGLRLRQVSELLLRESWMFGSGNGDASGPWTREIRASVRVARDAKNARELLDARAAVEWSASEPPLPDGEAMPETDEGSAAATQAEERKGASRLRRLWRSVTGNPYLATIAATLTLAGLALLYKGGSALVDSIDWGTSTTARGRVERAGEGGARTFGTPGVLAREGPAVKPGERVVVRCRVYAPQPPSALPDGYWYKLASSPWRGRYFATANSFWNGDKPGQLPYTHDTDFSVPKCP